MRKSDHFQSNHDLYADETEVLHQEAELQAGDSGFQLQSSLLDTVEEVFTLPENDSLFESCILCGRPIAKERLRESPWAATCAACDLKEDQALKSFLAT